MSDAGYIVFAHGSSVESANQAVRSVARELAQAGGYGHVVAAFLEGGRPDLSSAAGELASSGVSRVVVIPYFLTLGLHLQRDLPRLIGEARRDHPGLEIEVTPPLDGHPAMVAALLDRAKASIELDRTTEFAAEGRSPSSARPDGPARASIGQARTTEPGSAGALPITPSPEGRAGPVPTSIDQARTTEPGSAGPLPSSPSPEGRAGPLRTSIDQARTTELGSAGALPITPSPEGRAGPARTSIDQAGTTEPGSTGPLPITPSPEGRVGPVPTPDPICKPS